MFGAFILLYNSWHSVSIYGDSEYELTTGVEWTNQNTRKAILGVEILIKKGIRSMSSQKGRAFKAIHSISKY